MNYRIITDMTEQFIAHQMLPDLSLWQTMKEKHIPFSFDLEITARCNNDCSHCYICLPAGDSLAKSREMSIDEIKSIATQAADMGAVWCLITGGEPLLRQDFSEIYLSLKRLGLLVSVFTNACLIGEEHVQLFRKYPPRDIEVTVYGATRETYEAVTGKPGSFAAFRRGLYLLLDSNVKVRLKAMALRANAHEMPEMARFCREHTKDYFRFDPLLHLRFDGNGDRNKQIKAQRLSPEEIAAIEHADTERFGALQKGCDKLILPEAGHINCNHLFHCGAGCGSFSVSYDGRFRLCSSLWHPQCTYDLRAGILREAWQRFVPAVRDMQSDNDEFIAKCRKCPIVNLCLWCPAHAYLEVGKMDAWIDYFCQVAHERARSLGYEDHSCP
ncbi:MAG: radical SAM protein [Methanothrix sp.]|nr:radical SAM protein [Methanothrix sp.]